jgi:hypothetical protein
MAQTSPHTLNAHQDATVRALTELILPKTETPGAADVGTAEFIDLMLTEWYEESERTLFLNGLADVDSRPRSFFGKDFVNCNNEQQSGILAVLGEQMIEEGPEPPTPEGEFLVERNFYRMLRRLTLTAYYTSEAGATEELHFEVIPDGYSGCETLSPSKKAIEQK